MLSRVLFSTRVVSTRVIPARVVSATTHPPGYILPELVKFWGFAEEGLPPPSSSPPASFPYGPPLEFQEELSIPSGHNTFSHHLEPLGHTTVFEQTQFPGGMRDMVGSWLVDHPLK